MSGLGSAHMSPSVVAAVLAEQPVTLLGRRYVCADRPLAVIDPENPEDVERLDDLYQTTLETSPQFYSLREVMAAALRAFAAPTPPKPAEPTGRYAVVEDDKAREWCRIDVTGPLGYDWQLLGQPGVGSPMGSTYATWRDFNAVRVLSGGVTE